GAMCERFSFITSAGQTSAGQMIRSPTTYSAARQPTGRCAGLEGRWIKRRDRRSVPIFALVERGGKARAMPIDNTTSAELRRALKKHGDTKSALMTDEWQAYRRPAREFESHDTINHKEEEWTRGHVHTQTVENFFSVFKRGMKGVYQHCSEKHLAR